MVIILIFVLLICEGGEYPPTNIGAFHQKRKKESYLFGFCCLTQRYRDELQSQMPEIDIFTGLGIMRELMRL